ncbi:hypothetical protein ABZP36_033379 [Zizania latifolia]
MEALAKDFLTNFAGPHGEPKYLNILQDVANRKIRKVQIELDDLIQARLSDSSPLVTENTRRYIGIFADAIDELMPESMEAYSRVDESADGGADGTDPLQRMPPEIRRFFEVYIKAFSKMTPLTIRQVKASNIGQLVKISGIPLMQVAVYTCEECGFEIYQEVTARVFMPLFECPSQRCKLNKAKGNLILQLRASKFLKFQEHVPKGHIPRSLTVHLRGELTRKVHQIATFLSFKYEFKGDEQEQIDRLAEDGDIYNKLSRSLAPEIFGHEDVKKALLLLLVGAPHRKLTDGMKIRGDLHVCLMGDPGVAKSQFLKHIINVAPRGVYTTGRGSSGVGLTAAVQKDPLTNEFVLEGGALMDIFAPLLPAASSSFSTPASAASSNVVDDAPTGLGKA